MRAGFARLAICLVAAGSGITHGAEPSGAEPATVKGEAAGTAQPRPVRAVTPIFSQLVALTYPAGFVPVFQNITPGFYIQESVPAGQSVGQWTQMLTLTGAEGNPLSAADYLQAVGDRYQQRCPGTYRGQAFGKVRLGEYEGHAAFVGCGRTEEPPVRHEMALIITVKGAADVYTIQWAERGVAMNSAPVVDEPRWRARFEQLMPIRVCDRVEGEQPPYPSCLLKR